MGLASMLGCGLAVLLLASPAVSGGGAVVESGAHGSGLIGGEPIGGGPIGGGPIVGGPIVGGQEQLATLAQGLQEATADRDRLHQALAALQVRLTAIEQQGGLAGLIAAQTEVIADLARRLEATAPGAGAGASAAEGNDSGMPLADQGHVTGSAPVMSVRAALTDEVASLQAKLMATERRLELLIEQFASAQQLREQATAQATEARSQLAELNARAQQARMELQEAQLRADKAEKGYAALEQVHERGVTERERLSAELETTRARLAESLKHTLALDTRLANAEARVAELTVGTRATAPTPPGDKTARLDGAGGGAGGAEPRTMIQTAHQATANEVEAGAAAALPEFIAEPSALGAATNGVLPTSVAAPPGAAADVRIEPPRPQAAATTPMSAAAPTGNDRHGGHPAVYSVRTDDSLSKISAKVYGNAADWQRIYEANRDVLSTPDQLAPGMTLVIP